MCTAKFSLNLIGSLVGYFSSSRGLRQGDPVSPYLVLLAIKVLSLLFDEAAQNSQFLYHPKCQPLGISHLIFADDLFLLSTADVTSVTIMKPVLLEFTKLSGLTPNLNKSEVFLAGVSDELGAQPCDILGLQRGSFPVRYLGLPLISTRLSVSDCLVLIEKVQKKVKGWSSKLLAYAGRLQLVKSALLNLQIYWSSIFLIPKIVIKKIEAVLTAFLWKRIPTAKTRIKVSWQEMCKPVKQGVLGLTDLHTWDKALTMKQIWNIALKKRLCGLRGLTS